MREVVLRIPSAAVEDVLDRLLPIVPGGVREVAAGRHAELRIRGPGLPPDSELKRAAGRWPCDLTVREVPDSWHKRRVADYVPDVIGGRLVVRPDWAPPAGSGLLDIIVGEHRAFGAGTHPTTRGCLERLLEIEPRGSFADLGCGTGVLAILAAKLGWAPVTAVDLDPDSVRAALANAAANAVTISARAADLWQDPPPQADGLAANFFASLHLTIAPSLPDPPPRVALLSGFEPDEAVAVIAAYASRGMHEADSAVHDGWVVAILERD